MQYKIETKKIVLHFLKNKNDMFSNDRLEVEPDSVITVVRDGKYILSLAKNIVVGDVYMGVIKIINVSSWGILNYG